MTIKIPTKKNNSVPTSSTSDSGKKEFVIVPEGRYLAKVSKVTSRESDSTGNKYVQVALEVIKGPFSGNAVFENFMIEHPSERAIEVSTNRAEKLGTATGIELLESSDIVSMQADLLGKELLIHVKNTKKVYNGEERTYANVTRFEPGL